MFNIQILKDLLYKKNISNYDFAKKLVKSHKTIYNYLDGTSVIDVETLQKMADVLEVPVTYFFDGTDTAKSSVNEKESQKELETQQKEIELLNKRIELNLSALKMFTDNLTGLLYRIIFNLKKTYPELPDLDLITKKYPVDEVNEIQYYIDLTQTYASVFPMLNKYIDMLSIEDKKWWIEHVKRVDNILKSEKVIEQNESVLDLDFTYGFQL